MLRKCVVGIITRHSRCYAVVGNQENNHKSLRTPVAEELASQFGNIKIVKKLFKSNPDLGESHIYFWRTFINALFKFGFQPRDCFRIIDVHPSLLGYEEDKLEKVMQEWKKQSQLGMSDLKFVILNRPEFLAVSADAVKHRIPFLLSYCRSKDSLLTLLFLCPNVMQDDWEEILKKLEFLNEEMVVYTSEICSCRALSKPLQYIKMRFSVLEKCGLYTRPNPYYHKQTQKERLKLNNPKLKDITDKTDYSFARKVAKISFEEYEVYKCAFAECEQQVDDEMSQSSDEE